MPGSPKMYNIPTVYSYCYHTNLFAPLIVTNLGLLNVFLVNIFSNLIPSFLNNVTSLYFFNALPSIV